MKKYCIIILCALLCTMPLCAWSLFNLAPSRPECVTDELEDILYDYKFERDAETITNMTKGFSLDERQAIYDFYKLDGSKAADDNFDWFFPTFGWGSFSQGDTKGGLFLLVSDIVCYGASLAGTAMFTIGFLDMFGLTSIFYDVAGKDPYDAERAKNLFLGGIATAAIGVTLELLADCVYGSIRPRNYAKTQNAALENALGLSSSSTSVSFVPIVNPVQQSFGLALSMQW